MRWVAICAVVSGCAAVFDLERVPDAGELPMCAAADEDCDGQPNASDICPAEADQPGDDDDNDGVGNLCDTNRAVAGDQRVLFDGFDANEQPWLGAGWQRDAGVYVQPSTADTQLELQLAPMRSGVSVAAVLQDVSGPLDGRAGIYGIGGGATLRCSVVIKSGSRLLLMEAPAFNTNDEAPLAGSGAIWLQSGQRADNTYFCRARTATSADVELTLFGISPSVVERIGILTSSASARFSSVTVFAR